MNDKCYFFKNRFSIYIASSGLVKRSTDYYSIMESSCVITYNGVTTKSQNEASRRDAPERRLTRRKRRWSCLHAGWRHRVSCNKELPACERQITMLLSHTVQWRRTMRTRICVTEKLVALSSYLEPVRNARKIVSLLLYRRFLDVS